MTLKSSSDEAGKETSNGDDSDIMVLDNRDRYFIPKLLNILFKASIATGIYICN